MSYLFDLNINNFNDIIDNIDDIETLINLYYVSLTIKNLGKNHKKIIDEKIKELINKEFKFPINYYDKFEDYYVDLKSELRSIENDPIDLKIDLIFNIYMNLPKIYKDYILKTIFNNVYKDDDYLVAMLILIRILSINDFLNLNLLNLYDVIFNNYLLRYILYDSLISYSYINVNTLKKSIEILNDGGSNYVLDVFIDRYGDILNEYIDDKKIDYGTIKNIVYYIVNNLRTYPGTDDDFLTLKSIKRFINLLKKYPIKDDKYFNI